MSMKGELTPTDSQLLRILFERTKETKKRLRKEIKEQQHSTRKARAAELGLSISEVKAEDEAEFELFWKD